MEVDNEVERVLILCDEREAGMAKEMEIRLNSRRTNFVVTVNIWCQIGAPIAKLVSVAKTRFDKEQGKYDYVYLFGGAYDLITSESNIASGKYNNTGDLVDKMFSKMEKARNSLRKVALRPVICQLIGIDIYTYNKQAGDMQIECQNAINWGIPHLNRAINSLNKDLDCISPWIGSSIHATIHHKIHHKYLRLSDGFLPNTDTSNIWADAFAHAILKNCAWLDENDQDN